MTSNVRFCLVCDERAGNRDIGARKCQVFFIRSDSP